MKIRYNRFNIGSNTYLGSRLFLTSHLSIGRYSYIGRCSELYGHISIGNFVMLGQCVSILASDHVISIANKPMIFSGRPQQKLTVIEDDVWVGAHSIILPGIKIGYGSVIAAGSVVTKDVRPLSIVGGNPASFIRDRFSRVELSEYLNSDFSNINPSFCDPL